jgi:hypothetical protein
MASDTDRYNAGYFGIDVEWMPLHNYYMGAYFKSGVKWPQELTDHCNEVYRRIGFCGDVMACAVADWMKMKGDVTIRQLMQQNGL